MDRHPERSRIGGSKLKIARQNADDRSRLAVQPDHTANDVGVAAEFTSPERIAENGDVRSVRLHFAIEEIPTHRRLYAERPEKAGSDLCCENDLGFAVSGKSEGITGVARERLNALRRALPVEVVRIGSIRDLRADNVLSARFSQREESARLAIRQGAQESGVDNGKNGRVRA